MELTIVLVLFIGIVAAWLILPSSPAEQVGNSAPVIAASKA